MILELGRSRHTTDPQSGIEHPKAAPAHDWQVPCRHRRYLDDLRETSRGIFLLREFWRD